MQDPRLSQLAKVLVHHSCRVKQGDNVLIDVFGPDHDLVRALIPEIRAAGGYPFVQLHNHALIRAMLLDTDEEHMKRLGEIGLYQMKRMDCYIGIRGGQNVSELSDVPAVHMKWYTEHFVRPVHLGYRAVHTRWVLLRYPDSSMAQLANMSTEAFEDFYFRVCTLDYGRMAKAMEPLVKRMEEAKEVRIIGPGTDLTFSIEGMPVIPCSGQRNIPDGEVYTAPVRNSVNGTITFNTPTVFHGVNFENVRLRFVNGKIVEATANDTKRLNEILDTDEGARYIGEFSLGLHPRIRHPMKDILFDEKIDGSFHFTPGSAHEECDNGNRSAIHWDMVSIQREDYGGGEICFDGELIRKNGRFVVPDLEPLNPENLDISA
ncbi:aminopeptidase [Polycladomyces sp. WAk]|uniref:Aminopeptidase n=1 Tax=Polycladomyces zharkentensis TaxID=2807616 RepID=A0ABS2WGS8_9BACL|nr:aminopeptidase [Polycladomyces sp. WAk]MBN2908752.1 aminopeptidase [Polycladomyces sp. WAk]